MNIHELELLNRLSRRNINEKIISDLKLLRFNDVIDSIDLNIIVDILTKSVDRAQKLTRTEHLFVLNANKFNENSNLSYIAQQIKSGKKINELKPRLKTITIPEIITINDLAKLLKVDVLDIIEEQKKHHYNCYPKQKVEFYIAKKIAGYFNVNCKKEAKEKSINIRENTRKNTIKDKIIEITGHKDLRLEKLTEEQLNTIFNALLNNVKLYDIYKDGEFDFKLINQFNRTKEKFSNIRINTLKGLNTSQLETLLKFSQSNCEAINNLLNTENQASLIKSYLYFLQTFKKEDVVASFVSFLSPDELNIISKENIDDLSKIDQIMIGKKNGLSIEKILKYAKNIYSAEQMQEIRLGFEHNISSKKIAQYSNPDYSAEKMKILRQSIEIQINTGDLTEKAEDYLLENLEIYKSKITTDDIIYHINSLPLPQEDKDFFNKYKDKNRNIIDQILFAYKDGILDKLKPYLDENLSGYRLREIREGIKSGLSKEEIAFYSEIPTSLEMRKMRRIMELHKSMKDEINIKVISNVFKDYKKGLYSLDDLMKISNNLIISEFGKEYDIELFGKSHFENSRSKKQDESQWEDLAKRPPEQMKIIEKCKSDLQAEQIRNSFDQGLPPDIVKALIGMNGEKMREVKEALIGLRNTLQNYGYSLEETYSNIKSKIYLIRNNELTADEMRRIRQSFITGISEVDIIKKHLDIYSRKQTYYSTLVEHGLDRNIDELISYNTRNIQSGSIKREYEK